MTLYIEFHLIQSFAPSNLNRDDNGAPKDAVFGGYRRARVSSQCFKRCIRDRFRTSAILDASDVGTRTRWLSRTLSSELKSTGIADTTRFNEIVKLALKKKANKADGAERSAKDMDEDVGAALSYLLYVSPLELTAMRSVIDRHAGTLVQLAAKKNLKGADIPTSLRTDLGECLRQVRAVDIALFGRMLADLPEANQHAACQVAHAISTHKVEREFDYFTAVDDEGTAEETGAGMIGSVEFNAATFYRYAVLDMDKLEANLQGDPALAVKGLSAFAEGMVRALPTGKQNSFAAHNPPSFVGVVLRHGSPMNLCNAFERPISPRPDKAITAQSAAALAEHELRMARFYGDARDRWAVLDDTGSWPRTLGDSLPSLDALLTWLKTAVQQERDARAGAAPQAKAV
jgi:CRISPR system Cascade subunit CasC